MATLKLYQCDNTWTWVAGVYTEAEAQAIATAHNLLAHKHRTIMTVVVQKASVR